MMMVSEELSVRFDAVVMLTDSDWFTEPRSNRYHYATRFAKCLPVIFVQQDRIETGYSYEETGIENITILHLPEYRGATQRNLAFLERALFARNIMRPLLWAYGWRYWLWLQSKSAPLKIFHATEDYAYTYRNNASRMMEIRNTLAHVDGIVAVSQNVLDNYTGLMRGIPPAIVLMNGCDYSFWGIHPSEKAQVCARECNKRMIYQGGVNSRLDVSLLSNLAKRLSDWEILLCGRCFLERDDLELLQSSANIKLLGDLSLQQVRALCIDADVGLIPFKPTGAIYNSAPLKTFEYLATGLPVVSVDILALQPYPEVIDLVPNNAEAFAEAVLAAQNKRRDEAFIKRCCTYASEKDYDIRFRELRGFLAEIPDYPQARAQKTIHVLCDSKSMSNETSDLYAAMGAHSVHRIILQATAADAFWSPADTVAVCMVDGILPNLAYSLRKKLKRFKGHVLFIACGNDTKPVNMDQCFDARKRYNTYVLPTRPDADDIAQLDAYIDMVGECYANPINRNYYGNALRPNNGFGNGCRKLTNWLDTCADFGFWEVMEKTIFASLYRTKLIQKLRKTKFWDTKLRAIKRKLKGDVSAPR